MAEKVPYRNGRTLKYRVVYHVEPKLSVFPDDVIEPEIHKFVTPSEVQEMMGSNHGPANFMLLPGGELRLRVFNPKLQDYQYWPMNSDLFFAVPYEE